MNQESKSPKSGVKCKMSGVRVKTRSGFTLIEVLLYMAIMALLLLAIGLSMQAFLEARVRNQVIAEVNHEASKAMNLTLQSIRNATGITSPTAGNSADTLEVTVADAAKSPTCFRLSGGALQIAEGGASCGENGWTNLTDADIVTVSVKTGESAVFRNLTRSGTAGIIKVIFTIAHKEPANPRYFEQYEKDFQGAAALR